MKIQLRVLILLTFPFVLKAQNIPTIISEINPSSPSSNPTHIVVTLIEHNVSVDSYPT